MYFPSSFGPSARTELTPFIESNVTHPILSAFMLPPIRVAVTSILLVEKIFNASVLFPKSKLQSRRVSVHTDILLFVGVTSWYAVIRGFL